MRGGMVGVVGEGRDGGDDRVRGGMVGVVG